MTKGLLVESWPIPYGAAYGSGMDQVEFLGVEPVVFGIVDFEAAVWGNPIYCSIFALAPHLRCIREVVTWLIIMVSLP